MQETSPCCTCGEDTGSSSVFWCTPECMKQSYKERARETIQWYLDNENYGPAAWWRFEYRL